LNNGFSRRRALISAGLEEHKLDALLITSPASLRYLTGFTGSNGALLVLPGDAIFFTDPRYTIQASVEVSCQSKICKGPILPAVAAVGMALRLQRLGFERAAMS